MPAGILTLLPHARWQHHSPTEERARDLGHPPSLELVKRDSRAPGKHVEVQWRIPSEKGMRTVTVDGQAVFKQLSVDTLGMFKAPFEHLHFD